MGLVDIPEKVDRWLVLQDVVKDLLGCLSSPTNDIGSERRHVRGDVGAQDVDRAQLAEFRCHVRWIHLASRTYPWDSPARKANSQTFHFTCLSIDESG